MTLKISNLVLKGGHRPLHVAFSLSLGVHLFAHLLEGPRPRGNGHDQAALYFKRVD